MVAFLLAKGVSAVNHRVHLHRRIVEMPSPKPTKWVKQFASRLTELAPDLSSTQTELVGFALRMRGERGDPKVAAERYLAGDLGHLDDGEGFVGALHGLEEELGKAAAELCAGNGRGAFILVSSEQSGLFLIAGTLQDLVAVSGSFEAMLAAMQRGKEAAEAFQSLVKTIRAAIDATGMEVRMMSANPADLWDPECHIILGDLPFFEECVERISGANTD